MDLTSKVERKWYIYGTRHGIPPSVITFGVHVFRCFDPSSVNGICIDSLASIFCKFGLTVIKRQLFSDYGLVQITRKRMEVQKVMAQTMVKFHRSSGDINGTMALIDFLVAFHEFVLEYRINLSEDLFRKIEEEKCLKFEELAAHQQEEEEQKMKELVQNLSLNNSNNIITVNPVNKNQVPHRSEENICKLEENTKHQEVKIPKDGDHGSRTNKCDNCDMELAQEWCTTCQVGFCIACKRITHLSRSLSKHDFVPISQKPMQCKIHISNITSMYCRSCTKPLCLECIDDHIGHPLIRINIILDEGKSTIIRILSSIADNEHLLGSHRHSLSSSLHQLQEKINATKQKISSIDEMTSLSHQTTKELTTFIDALSATSNFELSSFKELQSFILKATDMNTLLSNYLSVESNFTLLE